MASKSVSLNIIAGYHPEKERRIPIRLWELEREFISRINGSKCEELNIRNSSFSPDEAFQIAAQMIKLHAYDFFLSGRKKIRYSQPNLAERNNTVDDIEQSDIGSVLSPYTRAFDFTNGVLDEASKNMGRSTYSNSPIITRTSDQFPPEFSRDDSDRTHKFDCFEFNCQTENGGWAALQHTVYILNWALSIQAKKLIKNPSLSTDTLFRRHFCDAWIMECPGSSAMSVLSISSRSKQDGFETQVGISNSSRFAVKPRTKDPNHISTQISVDCDDLPIRDGFSANSLLLWCALQLRHYYARKASSTYRHQIKEVISSLVKYAGYFTVNIGLYQSVGIADSCHECPDMTREDAINAIDSIRPYATILPAVLGLFPACTVSISHGNNENSEHFSHFLRDHGDDLKTSITFVPSRMKTLVDMVDIHEEYLQTLLMPIPSDVKNGSIKGSRYLLPCLIDIIESHLIFRNKSDMSDTTGRFIDTCITALGTLVLALPKIIHHLEQLKLSQNVHNTVKNSKKKSGKDKESAGSILALIAMSEIEVVSRIKKVLIRAFFESESSLVKALGLPCFSLSSGQGGVSSIGMGGLLEPTSAFQHQAVWDHFKRPQSFRYSLSAAALIVDALLTIRRISSNCQDIRAIENGLVMLSVALIQRDPEISLSFPPLPSLDSQCLGVDGLASFFSAALSSAPSSVPLTGDLHGNDDLGPGPLLNNNVKSGLFSNTLKEYVTSLSEYHVLNTALKNNVTGVASATIPAPQRPQVRLFLSAVLPILAPMKDKSAGDPLRSILFESIIQSTEMRLTSYLLLHSVSPMKQRKIRKFPQKTWSLQHLFMGSEYTRIIDAAVFIDTLSEKQKCDFPPIMCVILNDVDQLVDQGISGLIFMGKVLKRLSNRYQMGKRLTALRRRMTIFFQRTIVSFHGRDKCNERGTEIYKSVKDRIVRKVDKLMNIIQDRLCATYYLLSTYSVSVLCNLLPDIRKKITLLSSQTPDKDIYGRRLHRLHAGVTSLLHSILISSGKLFGYSLGSQSLSGKETKCFFIHNPITARELFAITCPILPLLKASFSSSHISTSFHELLVMACKDNDIRHGKGLHKIEKAYWRLVSSMSAGDHQENHFLSNISLSLEMISMQPHHPFRHILNIAALGLSGSIFPPLPPASSSSLEGGLPTGIVLGSQDLLTHHHSAVSIRNMRSNLDVPKSIIGIQEAAGHLVGSATRIPMEIEVRMDGFWSSKSSLSSGTSSCERYLLKMSLTSLLGSVSRGGELVFSDHYPRCVSDIGPGILPQSSKNDDDFPLRFVDGVFIKTIPNPEYSLFYSQLLYWSGLQGIAGMWESYQERVQHKIVDQKDSILRIATEVSVMNSGGIVPEAFVSSISQSLPRLNFPYYSNVEKKFKSVVSDATDAQFLLRRSHYGNLSETYDTLLQTHSGRKGSSFAVVDAHHIMFGPVSAAFVCYILRNVCLRPLVSKTVVLSTQITHKGASTTASSCILPSFSKLILPSAILKSEPHEPINFRLPVGSIKMKEPLSLQFSSLLNRIFLIGNTLIDVVNSSQSNMNSLCRISAEELLSGVVPCLGVSLGFAISSLSLVRSGSSTLLFQLDPCAITAPIPLLPITCSPEPISNLSFVSQIAMIAAVTRDAFSIIPNVLDNSAAGAFRSFRLARMLSTKRKSSQNVTESVKALHAPVLGPRNFGAVSSLLRIACVDHGLKFAAMDGTKPILSGVAETVIERRTGANIPWCVSLPVRDQTSNSRNGSSGSLLVQQGNINLQLTERIEQSYIVSPYTLCESTVSLLERAASPYKALLGARSDSGLQSVMPSSSHIFPEVNNTEGNFLHNMAALLNAHKVTASEPLLKVAENIVQSLHVTRNKFITKEFDGKVASKSRQKQSLIVNIPSLLDFVANFKLDVLQPMSPFVTIPHHSVVAGDFVGVNAGSTHFKVDTMKSLYIVLGSIADDAARVHNAVEGVLSATLLKHERKLTHISEHDEQTSEIYWLCCEVLRQRIEICNQMLRLVMRRDMKEDNGATSYASSSFMTHNNDEIGFNIPMKSNMPCTEVGFAVSGEELGQGDREVSLLLVSKARKVKASIVFCQLLFLEAFSHAAKSGILPSSSGSSPISNDTVISEIDHSARIPTKQKYALLCFNEIVLTQLSGVLTKQGNLYLWRCCLGFYNTDMKFPASHFFSVSNFGLRQHSFMKLYFPSFVKLDERKGMSPDTSLLLGDSREGFSDTELDSWTGEDEEFSERQEFRMHGEPYLLFATRVAESVWCNLRAMQRLRENGLYTSSIERNLSLLSDDLQKGKKDKSTKNGICWSAAENFLNGFYYPNGQSSSFSGKSPYLSAGTHIALCASICATLKEGLLDIVVSRGFGVLRPSLHSKSHASQQHLSLSELTATHTITTSATAVRVSSYPLVGVSESVLGYFFSLLTKVADAALLMTGNTPTPSTASAKIKANPLLAKKGSHLLGVISERLQISEKEEQAFTKILLLSHYVTGEKFFRVTGFDLVPIRRWKYQCEDRLFLSTTDEELSEALSYESHNTTDEIIRRVKKRSLTMSTTRHFSSKFIVHVFPSSHTPGVSNDTHHKSFESEILCSQLMDNVQLRLASRSASTESSTSAEASLSLTLRRWGESAGRLAMGESISLLRTLAKEFLSVYSYKIPYPKKSVLSMSDSLVLISDHDNRMIKRKTDLPSRSNVCKAVRTLLMYQHTGDIAFFTLLSLFPTCHFSMDKDRPRVSSDDFMGHMEPFKLLSVAFVVESAAMYNGKAPIVMLPAALFLAESLSIAFAQSSSYRNLNLIHKGDAASLLGLVTINFRIVFWDLLLVPSILHVPDADVPKLIQIVHEIDDLWSSIRGRISQPNFIDNGTPSIGVPFEGVRYKARNIAALIATPSCVEKAVTSFIEYDPKQVADFWNSPLLSNSLLHHRGSPLGCFGQEVGGLYGETKLNQGAIGIVSCTDPVSFGLYTILSEKSLLVIRKAAAESCSYKLQSSISEDIYAHKRKLLSVLTLIQVFTSLIGGAVTIMDADTGLGFAVSRLPPIIKGLLGSVQKEDKLTDSLTEALCRFYQVEECGSCIWPVIIGGFLGELVSLGARTACELKYLVNTSIKKIPKVKLESNRPRIGKCPDEEVLVSALGGLCDAAFEYLSDVGARCVFRMGSIATDLANELNRGANDTVPLNSRDVRDKLNDHGHQKNPTINVADDSIKQHILQRQRFSPQEKHSQLVKSIRFFVEVFESHLKSGVDPGGRKDISVSNRRTGKSTGNEPLILSAPSILKDTSLIIRSAHISTGVLWNTRLIERVAENVSTKSLLHRLITSKHRNFFIYRHSVEPFLLPAVSSLLDLTVQSLRSISPPLHQSAGLNDSQNTAPVVIASHNRDNIDISQNVSWSFYHRELMTLPVTRFGLGLLDDIIASEGTSLWGPLIFKRVQAVRIQADTLSRFPYLEGGLETPPMLLSVLSEAVDLVLFWETHTRAALPLSQGISVLLSRWRNKDQEHQANLLTEAAFIFPAMLESLCSAVVNLMGYKSWNKLKCLKAETRKVSSVEGKEENFLAFLRENLLSLLDTPECRSNKNTDNTEVYDEMVIIPTSLPEPLLVQLCSSIFFFDAFKQQTLAAYELMSSRGQNFGSHHSSRKGVYDTPLVAQSPRVGLFFAYAFQQLLESSINSHREGSFALVSSPLALSILTSQKLAYEMLISANKMVTKVNSESRRRSDSNLRGHAAPSQSLGNLPTSSSTLFQSVLTIKNSQHQSSQLDSSVRQRFTIFKPFANNVSLFNIQQLLRSLCYEAVSVGYKDIGNFLQTSIVAQLHPCVLRDVPASGDLTMPTSGEKLLYAKGVNDMISTLMRMNLGTTEYKIPSLISVTKTRDLTPLLHITELLGATVLVPQRWSPFDTKLRGQIGSSPRKRNMNEDSATDAFSMSQLSYVPFEESKSLSMQKRRRWGRDVVQSTSHSYISDCLRGSLEHIADAFPVADHLFARSSGRDSNDDKKRKKEKYTIDGKRSSTNSLFAEAFAKVDSTAAETSTVLGMMGANGGNTSSDTDISYALHPELFHAVSNPFEHVTLVRRIIEETYKLIGISDSGNHAEKNRFSGVYIGGGAMNVTTLLGSMEGFHLARVLCMLEEASIAYAEKVVTSNTYDVKNSPINPQLIQLLVFLKVLVRRSQKSVY